MSLDPSTINAYPWNPDVPACPLFLEPEVWSGALLDHHRRALKKAAKKAGRHGIIQVTDDQKIGEVCCWIMESPKRRRIFSHVLEKEGYTAIHQLLWMHFYLDEVELRGLFPQDTFTIEADKRIYIDPDAFKRRILEVKPQGNLLRSTCILGGAFALLQPDCSCAILEALLEYDPSLEGRLLCATSSTDQPEVDQAKDSDTQEVEVSALGLSSLLEARTAEPKELLVSRTWLENGRRIAEDFLAAETGLRERAESLRAVAEDLSLEEERPLKGGSEGLCEAAQRTHDAAVAVDSWIDEWLPSLQGLLISSPERIRPQAEALLSHFRSPRLTGSAMRVVCAEINRRLGSLAESLASSTASLQGLRSEIRQLCSELGIDAPNRDDGVIPDELIPCLSLTNKLRLEKDQLSRQLSSLIETRRAACAEQLALIDPELLERIPEFEAERRKLEERVSAAGRPGDLSSLESVIVDLRKKWPAIVPKLSSGELAKIALEADCKPSAVFDLIDTLVTDRRFAESALILEILQGAYEPEAADVEMNRFAVIVLRCWSELAKTNEFAESWSMYALSGSWIAKMNTGDLKDEALRQRFAGAFLALHAGHDSGALMGLFYALWLQHHPFRNTYPILQELLDAVVAQHAFRISDGKVETAVDEKWEAVRIFFQKQSNDDYIRQAAHGNEVAEAERVTVFPDLERLAGRVLGLLKNGQVDDAVSETDKLRALVEAAFRKHSLTTTESPFYQRKIFGQHGYLDTLASLLHELIGAHRKFREQFADDTAPIQQSYIEDEIDKAALQDVGFTDFWMAVRAAILANPAGQHLKVISVDTAIAALLSVSPDAILLCPNLVLRFCSTSESPAPSQDDLREVLHNLTNLNGQQTLQRLEDSGCLRHAVIAAKAIGMAAHEGLVRRLEQLLTQRESSLSARCEALMCAGSAEQPVRDIQDAIRKGKLWLANRDLIQAEKVSFAADIERRRQTESKADEILARVDACEREVLDTWDGDPAGQLVALSAQIKARLNQLKIRLKRSVLGESDFEAVMQTATALEFVVRNRSESFSELESLLGWGLVANSDGQNVPKPESDHLAWEDPELKEAWELLSRFQTVPDTDRQNVSRAWEVLAKAFCRMSAMYHDLHDSLRFEAVKDYPFGSFTSEFYNPRTAWLDRPIALFLFIKVDDWMDLWSRLSAHLAHHTDTHNVILMPSGFADLEKRFALKTSFGTFVVIDTKEAAAISRHPIPGARLRQILHRSAPRLTDVGVFCTDGAVHRRKNLFIGREIALQRIEQERASAIWGGRRIGKTSLLHALKDRLEDKKEPYRVAYVYADLSGPDPDLVLAKRVCESLGLREPANVNDLCSVIAEACQRHKVAVLVDEVDRYIQASRNAFGDAEFPFARAMRGISSQNPDRFKLVYAGFKQLYYEVHIRSNPDNAYPFKNFLKPLREDFGDFTPEKVEEFLKMAFEEMFGIEFDKSTPRLVKDKTSGHPAFVQAFGDRLLHRLEKRKRSGGTLAISPLDIEAVYNENPDGMGGHAAYIDYVYETLGWNLSHLGKAIMLALSNDIIASSHPVSHSYQATHIADALVRWSNQPRLNPEESDFVNALHFLVMTNMLTKRLECNVDVYLISYPSYIDFMVKFGDTERLAVDESLRNYQKDEVGKIA